MPIFGLPTCRAAIFLFVLFLSLCNPCLKASAAGDNAGKKTVIATFYPLYIHLLNIAGDKIKAELLLSPGVSIHDFSCKPSDIKKISGADLMILNGASLDDFAMKFAVNYAGSGLKTIDASYGVELISASCDGGCSHGHEGEKSSGHAHGGAPNAPSDPHTWISLKNAALQVNNILKALCETDPANAGFYSENAAAYAAALAGLDKYAGEKLAPFKGSKFMVFHGSFAYFARDYSLVQSSIADVFGNAPKPSKIKEVYDLIKAGEVKFLISEPAYQNKEIKALAEQYSLSVIELDPMGSYEAGTASKTGANEKNYYLDVMKSNIDKLAVAFSGAKK